VLGYSTVDSMATEYADAMANASAEEWPPNKSIW